MNKQLMLVLCMILTLNFIIAVDIVDSIPPLCSDEYSEVTTNSGLDSSDDSYLQTDGSDDYSKYHYFVFNVGNNVTVADITSFNVTWEGSADSENYGLDLYIWDATDTEWDNIKNWGSVPISDTSTSSNIVNIDRYVDSGNIRLAVFYDGYYGANLSTDFVRIVVNYSDLSITFLSPTTEDPVSIISGNNITLEFDVQNVTTEINDSVSINSISIDGTEVTYGNLSYNGTSWEIEITTPSKSDGLYDLFLNFSYSSVNYIKNESQSINYSTSTDNGGNGGSGPSSSGGGSSSSSEEEEEEEEEEPTIKGNESELSPNGTQKDIRIFTKELTESISPFMLTMIIIIVVIIIIIMFFAYLLDKKFRKKQS